MESESILLVKVPKNENWNTNLFGINMIYNSEISMNPKKSFNNYDFGTGESSYSKYDKKLYFEESSYFSTSNYDVYIFPIKNRYTFIKILYIEKQFLHNNIKPMDINFYLTEKPTADSFVIELPANHLPGNYKIKCLNENENENDNLIGHCKNILKVKEKLEIINNKMSSTKGDQWRRYNNLEGIKNKISYIINSKKTQIKEKGNSKIKKARNKKITFFILGIVTLALLATFCTLGFGFALIAAKIAIALIVLTAIASAASFLFSVIFRKKANDISNKTQGKIEKLNEFNQQNEKSIDQKIENLNQQIENLGNQIIEKQNKIKTLSQKIENLDNQIIKKWDQEIEKLDKIKTLNQEIENLNLEIENLQEIENLNQQIENLNQQIENLNQQIETLENKEAFLQIDELKDKIKDENKLQIETFESITVNSNENEPNMQPELKQQLDKLQQKIDKLQPKSQKNSNYQNRK